MRKLFCFLFVIASTQVFAQTVLEKIEALMAAYASDHKFNGSVLVAQKGKIIYEKGFGFKNAEEKITNDANGIFQIGSITKQFTSAIIMQLQQEKKLSVRDKLSKYFPGFVNGDKITIENLLTHTSGLHNYTDDTLFMRDDVSRPRSKQEMIDRFKSYPSDFEPGSKWSYSNSGYSMLGYIIEKVTGQPYERVVRLRILQPLKMTHTGFDFTRLSDPNKTRGYFFRPDKLTPAPIVDSTIAFSAGALYSTVGDLYKWERAIRTNKILAPTSWKSVFTPLKNGYGYGWSIDSLYGKLYTSHSGGIHGFSSYIIRFPKEDVAVIMLDNYSSTFLSKISKSLAAIVFNEPFDVPEPVREVKLSSGVLRQYVGVYELAPGFSITVSLYGDHLRAQATGQPAFEIFAEKENVFFLKAVEAKIEFVKDEVGRVIELILYQNGMTPHGKKIR